ncbi:serine/threonine-protein kinase [Streptomyces sp. CC219B]|uniref:serine/threonine-protein kinase n=1 Tax=Streptomyces sp. CC219B TaxID=3044574 RepID=UPI0024A91B7B|nr:serine/threonine-protein kinase [Streptomyces sp. CC219B]
MQRATEAFEPLRADDPAQVAGYRLAARLGAGGMGQVYLAHTQGGRPVAIKVVRPELADDPDFRHRFRREIAAARRVRGAYTAELIDADAESSPPWLATLYVPGPSLADAVRRRGPLPVSAVLRLMAGTAEALQAIHGAGIVHRDLKPSNVLLAADGPRVIDFGISLAADVTSHTATGTSIGTPQFMAPEQATAGEVTAATDVFALGQTAAFAALGRALHGDGPAATVLYRIVHEEPDLSPLPEQLRPLIARCLAKDPGERATPAEIVEWCREELGEDAAPTVWREITGPEVTVPDPTLVAVPAPTRPLHGQPLIAPPQSTVPVVRQTRRGRTALMAAVAVTAGALLAGGTAWTLLDGSAEGGGRDGAGAGSVRTSVAASASAASASGAAAAGDDGASGRSDREPSDPTPTPTASGTPGPEGHAQLWLDEANSLSFDKPVQRKDRKGDIRLNCATIGCALESDTSTIIQIFGGRGTSLDECRLLMSSANSHSFGLSAGAAGTEYCVKHRDGDMALLVLQTKSTALWNKPGLSFLTLDMTVWRAGAKR